MHILRDKIQISLFQHVRDNTKSIQRASAHFANLLLLLPSVTKLASLYHENAQLARMFGKEIMNPFLIEILLDSTINSIGNFNDINCDDSELFKQKSVSTQTQLQLEIPVAASPSDFFSNDSGISSANLSNLSNNYTNNIIDIGLELAQVVDSKRRCRSEQTSGSSGISAGSLNNPMDLFQNADEKNLPINHLISVNCYNNSSNVSRNCSPIQQQYIKSDTKTTEYNFYNNYISQMHQNYNTFPKQQPIYGQQYNCFSNESITNVLQQTNQQQYPENFIKFA